MIYRQWFGEGEPDGAIVLLHEGLGSVAAWGGFPDALAEATRRPVLAYDRAGYGRSVAKPGPWPARFMHAEAVAVGELLASEGVRRPVFVGHSDGATISLLYPWSGPRAELAAQAIVSLSAHVLVEPVCVEVIENLRATYRDQLAGALARHHDDADATFDAWSEVWASQRFRPWTIDAELAEVTCPVLAIQGADDAYGTIEQLHRVAAGVAGPVETIELPGVDHWPHREAPEQTLAAITAFLADLEDKPG